MRKLLISAIICLAFSPLQAQLRFAAVQEVWAYADAHNITVRAATVNEQLTALSEKQAKGALLPTVSANGSFNDNISISPTLIPANLFDPTAPAGSFYEATFGRRYNYTGNVNVQLDLLNTHNWFAVKTAKLDKEIAALNIAKTKRDLYSELAAVYYTYLLADQAEILAAANRLAMDSLFTSATYKHKEGIISEVTLNSAAINLQKAEKSFVAATENKLLQLNSLQQLLNTADSIVIVHHQSAAPESAAFAPDPDVAIAQEQLALAGMQVKASKAAFAPSLSAVYQYNTTISGDDFLKFNNTNTLPGQYWGLRLSVPIFSGNSRRYNVQKAQMDQSLKQQQYETAGLQSQLTNENVTLSYNTAAKDLDKATSILALYRNNDAHATQLLNEGAISVDDRLKYYTDLVTSQQEYLQSMSTFFIQAYRLQIRTINIK